MALTKEKRDAAIGAAVVAGVLLIVVLGLLWLNSKYHWTSGSTTTETTDSTSTVTVKPPASGTMITITRTVNGQTETVQIDSATFYKTFAVGVPRLNIQTNYYDFDSTDDDDDCNCE